MKTPLFIANIVAAILLVNLAFSNPSITGAAITNAKETLFSPVTIINIFVITIVALDVYYFFRAQKYK